MLTLEFVSSFIYENLNLVSTTDGRNFNARCPFCGDSKKNPYKKRFHLKYTNENIIFFNCFNCQKTGTFFDLYSHITGLSITDTLKKLKYSKDLSKLRDRFSNKVDAHIIKQDNINIVSTNDFRYILSDCISLEDIPAGHIQLRLYEVLKTFYTDRCLDSTEYKFYICYKGEWKNRIIIPIYEDEKIIFFQGRSISDNMLPKYKNPTTEKKQVILHKNLFKKDKYIVVTEGIIDALSVGIQSTVCLGADVSDNFLNLISKYTDIGIIIALDNDDAGKNGILKIINESKYKNTLKFFIMPNKYKHIKDLNELKVKEKIEDIFSFILDNIYNKLETKIRLRI